MELIPAFKGSESLPCFEDNSRSFRPSDAKTFSHPIELRDLLDMPGIIPMHPSAPVPFALVGGKCAGLLELSSIEEIRVPEFFISTAAAYHRYVVHNSLTPRIEGLEAASREFLRLRIDGADTGLIEARIGRLCREVQEAFLQGVQPGE